MTSMVHGGERVHREALTPSELRVLRLVISGHSNKQIARLIHVSEHTVKFHLKNVFAKLGAHRRTQAVAIAAALGLTKPDLARSASLAA